MSGDEMIVHRDPETTPAQEKIQRLTREFKESLVSLGYPVSEAHAKTADFKAALLERIGEELRDERVQPPVEYRRWFRPGKRMAWLRGLDYAQDHVFRAMMRQESWARVLRKPNRTVEGE